MEGPIATQQACVSRCVRPVACSNSETKHTAAVDRYRAWWRIQWRHEQGSGVWLIESESGVSCSASSHYTLSELPELCGLARQIAPPAWICQKSCIFPAECIYVFDVIRWIAERNCRLFRTPKQVTAIRSYFP
jgi:hypothetical protein